MALDINKNNNLAIKKHFSNHVYLNFGILMPVCVYFLNFVNNRILKYLYEATEFQYFLILSPFLWFQKHEDLQKYILYNHK